jgi:hypothetical protein
MANRAKNGMYFIKPLFEVLEAIHMPRISLHDKKHYRAEAILSF